MFAISDELRYNGLLAPSSVAFGKAAAELFTASDIRSQLETTWYSSESYSAYMSVGENSKKTLVCSLPLPRLPKDSIPRPNSLVRYYTDRRDAAARPSWRSGLHMTVQQRQ